MAFNTPFKMWKRYEFDGGTSDPCIISWPAGMKAHGEIRDQYHHAIDLVPTVLDVLGVEAPAAIKGHVQSHVRRREHALQPRRRRRANRPARPSSTRCSARGRSGTTAGRPSPPIRRWRAGAISTTTNGSSTTPTSTAPSCTTSRASSPDKLRELVNLWHAEAGADGAFPLDDRSPLEIMTDAPAGPLAGTRSLRLLPRYRRCARVAGGRTSATAPTSIGALVDIPAPGAEGVLFAHGSRFGGHALYHQGQPAALRLQLRWHALSRLVVGSEDVPTGDNQILSASFDKTGEDPPGVANGVLSLYHGDTQGRRGDDQDPAGEVRDRRRRALHRPRQRLRRNPTSTPASGPGLHRRHHPDASPSTSAASPTATSSAKPTPMLIARIAGRRAPGKAEGVSRPQADVPSRTRPAKPPRVPSSGSRPVGWTAWLECWTVGMTAPPRRAIVGFVERTISEAVPVEERVAVFDNDGTLWCEEAYCRSRLDFILRRLYPRWRRTIPSLA